MGCDIHCFVEKRINGEWSKIAGFISDSYNANSDYFSTEEYLNVDNPLSLRNYSLFSYLAGVRSSNKVLKPISSPKGLPDDCCVEIIQAARDMYGDGHSHSWCTVKEIIDNLNQDCEYEGIVTFKNYLIYKQTGVFPKCCSCILNITTSIYTTSEFDNRIEWSWLDTDGVTVMKWKVPLAEVLKDFIDKTLSQLIDRCEDPDCADVRLIFWFDN